MEILQSTIHSGTNEVPLLKKQNSYMIFVIILPHEIIFVVQSMRLGCKLVSRGKNKASGCHINTYVQANYMTQMLICKASFSVTYHVRKFLKHSSHSVPKKKVQEVTEDTACLGIG